MKIAQFNLENPLALAPMAGVSDNPFRRICREFGASWTVGEMISGDPALRHTAKTATRIDFSGEEAPIVVQIAGADPDKMARSAHYYAQKGAHIIDINMGCPAKKVCQAESGSALMKNEALVADILRAVVDAAGIPVTLKTRLGWDDNHLNVMTIAQIAQQSGIAALAIHGRSRTQMYQGEARYDLIAQVKKTIDLPLWVNGDITDAHKAARVMNETGADGVMIGRAAQGAPWIFEEMAQFFKTGHYQPFQPAQKKAVILRHLRDLYAFYGEDSGYKIARKHLIHYFKNYFKNFDNRLTSIPNIISLPNAKLQYEAVEELLNKNHFF